MDHIIVKEQPLALSAGEPSVSGKVMSRDDGQDIPPHDHETVAYGALASFGLAMAGGLSWLSFMALPYEISLLVARFSVTTELASWIASGEVLALACAATISGKFMPRVDKRMFTIAGLIVALLGNILSASSTDLTLLILARIVCGSALGVVSAASNALAVNHPRPERMYAFMMVGLSVVFCIVMYVEPLLAASIGTAGLPVLEAFLIAIFGWAAFFLPRGRSIAATTATVAAAKPKLTLRLQLLLVAIFILFLANSIIWAFADQAAARAGVAASLVGPLFTVSGMLMLGGGLAAAWLGDRRGYLIPLVAGAGGQVFSSITIYSMNSHSLYLAGILIFNGALIFALPYAQAVLAELDESATAVAYSGAAVNFGGALGPAAGALMIPYGFQFIGYSGAILSAAGIFMVINGTRAAEHKLAARR